MKRPRPALVVLALSLTALIATPLVVAGTSDSQVTQVETVGSRSLPTPTPTRFTPGAPEFKFSVVTNEVKERGAAPVAVQIARGDVSATIIETGVDDIGQAEVPEDVAQVGWYRFGNTPADAQGSVVLVGHRDGRVEGAGVFYDLGSLTVDDVIAVTDADGKVWEYAVVSREAIKRDALPTDELFVRTGDPQLVLISCGGVYDRGSGGYRDNIVVTARPIVGKQ
jgi:sortase (surface protein transpeptidase)